jgi:hypothetical protein
MVFLTAFLRQREIFLASHGDWPLMEVSETREERAVGQPEEGRDKV